jgi:hypothetical protein
VSPSAPPGPADSPRAGAAQESPILLGDVCTALLRHSRAVGEPIAEEILDLAPALPVRSIARPLRRTMSPDVVEGIHCRLPSGSGRRVEGIGTVASRATLTGGRIAQVASRVLVVAGAQGPRQGWSSYLASPGRVERIGRGRSDDLVAGFLGPRPSGVLDLDAVAGRLLDRVQAAGPLDGAVPLRAIRTRLRFVVSAGSQQLPGPPPRFSVNENGVRTLLLTTPLDDPDSVVALCEDVAVHDWLLTTLQRLVDGLDEAPSRVDRIQRLAPAIEQLLHLWMPGAHTGITLAWVWAALEGRPGFSRQWSSIVARIRNELDLSVLRALSRSDLPAGVHRPAGEL